MIAVHRRPQRVTLMQAQHSGLLLSRSRDYNEVTAADFLS